MKYGECGMNFVSRVIRTKELKINSESLNKWLEQCKRSIDYGENKIQHWEQGLKLIMDKKSFYEDEGALYFLGEPTALPKTIVKSSGLKMINPNRALRFDELLKNTELAPGM
jgi:hypothetical protein